MGAAMDAATKVKQITGLEIGVWTTMLSPEVGMLAWTAQADHLAEFETATDKLAADNGYLDWVASVDSFFEGPLTDGVLEVVNGELSGDRPGYVGVTTAVCANGAVSAAMAGGVEVAQTATRITGNTTLFCSSLTGHYAGVAWVAGVADLAAFEQAGAALAGSPEWLALIDRIGPLFGPNPESTIYRRIG